ncbi:TPA: hypothetical protein U8209_003673 [Pseudomonas putida]|nr:hypothetical protein [Pseudomonas putida]
MEIENQIPEALQAFYEVQLVLTTEYVLDKIGLPRNTTKALLDMMSKDEMQTFLDNHAKFMQMQLIS